MRRVEISRHLSIDEDAESVSSGDSSSLTLVSVPSASSDGFSPRATANTVLPSIEGPVEDVSDGEWSSTSSSTPGMGTPSLSLTRSESPSDHVSTPAGGRRSATRSTGMQSLDANLRGLRLSPPAPMDNMSGIADVLPEVAAGRDSRAGSLLEARSQGSVSPSPRRLSAHRRRSGSRNVVERHDVGDEVPPNDRFNDPAFQRVFREAKGLMRTLADILGSSAVHNQPDSVMQRLHRKAGDLARFQCPPSRTVGLIGASGAGKSSLLNSLLDCRDLIRTSSGGAACTCAVIEYHFHAEERIAIEVEQFAEDEMMTQLEDHLNDYRHFHLNRDSLASESSRDSERYTDFEDRATLAMDTFRAVFGGRRVNNNRLISGTEEHVLELFRRWIQESGPANVPRRQGGLTNDECSAILIRLTSENASASGPATWPWVKKIKVYLNAYILRKGLILVDLPGLEDSNAARRNITERYFINCDEIFVVCVEARAVTNEGVKNVVELAKDANISNVSIVCTKSDAYNNPVEAQRDFPGQTADLIEQMVTAKAQLETDEEEIEEELEEYQEYVQDIAYERLTADQSRELNRLHGDLREIRRRLTELEFDLQQFMITTCNESVQSQLHAEYGHQFPDGTLRVFCVSNKIYWDNREAPKDAAMPHLVLSGILALRAHAMAMVWQSQFAAANQYMRGDVGLLLRELGLWVQTGQGSLSAERKELVRSTLATVERELRESLCGRSSDLQKIAKRYRENFDAVIYQSQIGHMANWSAAARHASSNWDRLHHASYDAFCRHFGVHAVRGEAARCWNQEIIEAMVGDLTPPWGALSMSITGTNDGVSGTIDAIFDSVSDILESRLDDSSDAAITLISTLGLHKQQLRGHIETILDQRQRDLRTLRTDALSSLRSSYIGRAMETAYSRAAHESGTGRHARQKAVINGTVRDDALFAGLLGGFRMEFTQQAETTQALIRGVLLSYLDNIRDTFNIVRDENVVLESESDPAFRDRVEAGVRATEDEMERIYEVLQS
ncbi:hypothetical protein F4802DRAFT_568804 [Xylaria palmicola]|nr:hypothetical protein F4802DRAFT_568804 [Xylaria palmicola]